MQCSQCNVAAASDSHISLGRNILLNGWMGDHKEETSFRNKVTKLYLSFKSALGSVRDPFLIPNFFDRKQWLGGQIERKLINIIPFIQRVPDSKCSGKCAWPLLDTLGAIEKSCSWSIEFAIIFFPIVTRDCLQILKLLSSDYFSKIHKKNLSGNIFRR